VTEGRAGKKPRPLPARKRPALPFRAAIREVLPEAAWQCCYVHFLRNALDYVPRRVKDDCLQELRWIQVRQAVQLGGGAPQTMIA
jgi:hypothetical protein